MKEYFSLAEAAEVLGKSKETLRRWDREGRLIAVREPISNYRIYNKKQLSLFLDLQSNELADVVDNSVKPHKDYKVVELFAGAGGLAIGIEKAGIKCAALNEIDKWACQTLRKNRPNWNVLEGDIKTFDFQNTKMKLILLRVASLVKLLVMPEKSWGFKMLVVRYSMNLPE